MKFGNNKENKDTRDINYLTKKYKEENEPLYQQQANEYIKWFNDNYNRIVRELKKKNCYDEDIVNDTFIRLYEIVQYKNTIQDPLSYFIRSYYTNWFQNNMKNKKIMETHTSMNLISKFEEDNNINPNLIPIEDKIIDEDMFEKEEKIYKNNIDKQKLNLIMKYVYEKYTLQEFELFKIYIHCKKNISYKKLSEITSIKLSIISNSIKTIKKDINDNRENILKDIQYII